MPSESVGNWLGGNQYELQAYLASLGLDTELTSQSYDMNQLLTGELHWASAMTYNELGLVLEEGYDLDDLNVIYMRDTDVAMMEDCLFVDSEWAAANQDTVRAFLRASIKGWAFARFDFRLLALRLLHRDDGHARILIELGDRHQRRAVCNGRQQVRDPRRAELRVAALHGIDLRRRAALDDGDIQPLFFIEAQHVRRVVAHELGLTQPLELKRDRGELTVGAVVRVVRFGGCACCKGQHRRCEQTGSYNKGKLFHNGNLHKNLKQVQDFLCEACQRMARFSMTATIAYMMSPTTTAIKMYAHAAVRFCVSNAVLNTFPSPIDVV